MDATEDVVSDATQVRADRCAELGEILTGMLPLIVEAQGNARKLEELRPGLHRLRAVAELGDSGVDEPAYSRWVEGARTNLTDFEDAIDRGDAVALWAVFKDQDRGLNLLSLGCAGCAGW